MNMAQANSFRGESPDESFFGMSSNKNAWDYNKDASFAGCVVGFVIFAIAYVFVIIALMHDIMSKLKEYDQDIEDDKRQLKELGFDIHSEECEEQLAMRLSG